MSSSTSLAAQGRTPIKMTYSAIVVSTLLIIIVLKGTSPCWVSLSEVFFTILVNVISKMSAILF